MLAIACALLGLCPQGSGWKSLSLRTVDELPVAGLHPGGLLRLFSEQRLDLEGSNSSALAALIRGRVRRDEKGRVLVDPGSVGEDWRALSPGEPTVVDWFEAGRSVRLQFFERGGHWWVCSASAIEGAKGDLVLQLVDANADGDFLDPQDLVRFGGGVLRPIGGDLVVDDGSAAWRFRLTFRSGKTRLQYSVMQSTPAEADLNQKAAFETLNSLRNSQGFAPAQYSEELSEALVSHTEYLQFHDPKKEGTLSSYFGEEKERELYSIEGDSISRLGNVNYLTPGVDTQRHVNSLLEMTHSRMNGFKPGRPEFDYGLTSSWSFLALRGTEGDTGADYWVLPGAGASELPRSGNRNWPFPKSYPTLYDEPRGLPISIDIPDHQLDDGEYLGVRTLGLSHASSMEELGGFFFSIEDVLPGHPPSVWFFVPAEPLSPNTEFLAQVILETRRSAEGGPGVLVHEELVQWSFSTGD